MTKTKTVLVTGGAGFVGRALCKALIKSGKYVVHSLDNYFTGSKSNHIPGVHYINGNSWEIESLIDFTPDLVFHFGEYSRVEQSFSDIDYVFQSNIVGTYEVIKFCSKAGAKLIYAGSSTKFGDLGKNKNESPYAYTKSYNTNLVKNYADWYGLNYAITYFYNVYGPGERRSGKYATLIGLFSEKMRKNESLSIVLPGTQRRNFTHINDTVRALVLVSELGLGDGYGIANERSYSVEEVASLFGGDVNYLKERAGNRMGAELVCEKTIALGWKATEQLPDFIEELRKNSWLDKE